VAYQLVINLRGRAFRHRIEPGENVVGSSPECDIRIKHPSVSRRHAVLSVDNGAVRLEDLGSSNGTRVGGRTVKADTRVEPGQSLDFGSVGAVLEEVAPGDLEMAVPLSPATGGAEAIAPESRGPVSTVGPAVVERFCLRLLPGLADAVADGESSTDVARAVGAALLRAMPCSAVEVVAGSPPREGVLFSARCETAGDVVPVAADAGAGRTLRVDFLGAAVAESYEPLVRVAAALIRAADRGPARAPRPPVELDSRPLPPAPPSVVPAFREVYEEAARVARGRVSVLIRGESGTGKELLARFIHAASDRAAAPLVTLNCAALPRDLLESELFGVERGVATGVEARAGKFEAAHGGTLFLDEIGDMAIETQARILRVLAEGEVFRIGGHGPRPADTRVISATNRDLDAMLDDGRFRADLYHRIADWVVELPPLRRRRADIPNLAAHFLTRACAERGVRAAGISRAAVEVLTAYHWPGNVRQLEKEMARAALFLEDGEILDSGRLQKVIGSAPRPAAGATLKEVREQAERAHIERVLADCDGAVADAAALLGIGLSTLYQRMKDLEIG
jgi:DNA-binding NtrC family response regulator